MTGAGLSVGPRTVQIATLDDVSETVMRYWKSAYEERGSRVQQSPEYAHAVSGTGSRVVVAAGCGVVAAFTLGEGVCTAIGGDEPLLGALAPDPERLVAVVAAVRAQTGMSVYLPLVDGRYAGVAGRGEFACWGRPPNSVIDWAEQHGRDLWNRACSRGNSQLARKRRLVERDGLTLDTCTTGEAAVRDLLAVDDRSWKAERGQSLRQRGGQAELYSALLRRGTLSVTFLRDEQTPVAFRLEARTRNQLTCLKWSYDESAKRYSPGLYLLTEGLVRQWGETDLHVVDLFGGPDALKDLIYTHRVPRVDVWCGDPYEGAERARDRRAFDTRVGQAREDGKGLRHAYS